MQCKRDDGDQPSVALLDNKFTFVKGCLPYMEKNFDQFPYQCKLEKKRKIIPIICKEAAVHVQSLIAGEASYPYTMTITLKVSSRFILIKILLFLPRLVKFG